MRPLVPKGEVIAASQLHPDGNRVVVQLYITSEQAPVGAGILFVRKLIKIAPDGDAVLLDSISDSLPDPDPDPGDEIYVASGETVPILACTATAFFGIRAAPNGTVTIKTSELNAARHLAQTGHATPMPHMRQIPRGLTVLCAAPTLGKSRRRCPSWTITLATPVVTTVPSSDPSRAPQEPNGHPDSRPCQEGHCNHALDQVLHGLRDFDALRHGHHRRTATADSHVTAARRRNRPRNHWMARHSGELYSSEHFGDVRFQLVDRTVRLRKRWFGTDCRSRELCQLRQRLGARYDRRLSLADDHYELHPPCIRPRFRIHGQHSNVWSVFEWSTLYGAGERTFDGVVKFSTFTETEPNARSLAAALCALFILFSFMVVILRTTSRLVSEKREGFREHLHVMGTTDFAYVASVFASSMLTMVPICVIIAVMARVVWWRGVDIFMIWLTCQLYALSMISVAFLMPSIFNSTTWASVISMLMFGGGICLAPLITALTTSLQTALCLIFPVFNAWYSLTHALSRDTIAFDVPYETTIGFFFVQIIVYGLLGHYLYRLFPGKYGTPAHPLWFLTRGPNSEHVDAVAADHVHQVVMQDLKKYFGDQRTNASVDLTLSIRRGEILALLGHNGAGKTTTIGMLTGLIEPTEYHTATFEGLDLRAHMDVIRLNVGVCPQHDVLFPSLSARQHFELFANLRGVDISRNRLDELLMFLELPLDDKPVSKYSGGMKRRVSVASALVGEPAVVFLDEPTTGVDEVSRQKLWELLKIERQKGTTMILTTHMMEEAEVLGNRIAIMSAGKLHSLGSAVELKEQYGSGYYLEVAKQPHYKDAEALELVQRLVPRASIQMDSAVEVTYFLPTESHEKYAELLETFEGDMSSLGAASYGLNMSTLEDVFVSIAEGDTADGSPDAAKKTYDHTEDQIIRQVQYVHNMSCTHIFDEDPGSHPLKIAHDTKNTFLKRLVSLRVMYFELLLQVVIPIILIIAGFFAVFEKNSCNAHPGSDLEDWPDVSWVTAPMFADNLTAVELTTATAFAINFKELFVRRFPGSDFSLPVVTSPGEWSANTWTVDRSFSYNGGGHATVTFLKFMMTHSNELTVGVRPEEASTSFHALMLSMASAALHKAVNPADAHAMVYNEMLPVKVEESTITPTPTATHEGAPTVDTRCDKQTWALTLLLLLAILFQTFPAMITINDELNRSVFDTFLAHGVTPIGYWLGNFLFDVIFTLIFPIGVVIGTVSADLQQWTDDKDSSLPAVFFFVWMYCICQLLMSYAVLVWNKASKLSAHITMNLTVFLVSFLLPQIILTPMNAAGVHLEHPGWPMLDGIFPAYAFWNVVNYKRDLHRYENPSGAVPFIMVFVYQVVAVAVIAYRMNRGHVVNRHTPSNDGIPIDIFVDADVETEMRRLDDQCRSGENMQGSGRPACAVAANHVWMKYKGDKIAVKGVTFGVNPGECFGLLGSNGAGKTSTMRILQLEFDPSGGAVTFGDLPDTYSAPVDVARQVIRQGVCQQHDTLIGPLSGEEHLHLYLKFRLGHRYHHDDWIDYVNSVMAVAQLPLHKRAEAYSGGMKRKLAVAIALFTGSKVVYLDEPSTGLDPFARRLLWRMITASLSPQRAMVLTTHSMDEADAVCSRISIIDDGTMKCIGSAQHLKQRYGSGYVVHVITTEDTIVEEVDDGMKRLFGDQCRVGHVAGSLRQYPIGPVTSLAATYKMLEQVTGGWHLERFAVSQSNLQQVFIAFAQNLHHGGAN